MPRTGLMMGINLKNIYCFTTYTDNFFLFFVFFLFQYLSIHFFFFYFLWSAHRHYFKFTQPPLVIFSPEKERLSLINPGFDLMSKPFFFHIFLRHFESVFYSFSMNYKGAFLPSYLYIVDYHSLIFYLGGNHQFIK